MRGMCTTKIRTLSQLGARKTHFPLNLTDRRTSLLKIYATYLSKDFNLFLYVDDLKKLKALLFWSIRFNWIIDINCQNIYQLFL